MDFLAVLGRDAVAVLRPANAPWAIGPAAWAVATAALIAGTASVFVRTVNRIFGTLVGALVAAGLLAVVSSGLPLVVATALALGLSCFRHRN